MAPGWEPLVYVFTKAGIFALKQSILSTPFVTINEKTMSLPAAFFPRYD